MSNRRDTFRAALAEVRDAELCVGGARFSVSIIEESSGGLSVAATARPELARGCEAELATYDGDCLRVEVMHLSEREGSTHIGLRRIEPEIRRGRIISPRRTVSPLVVLIGVTLGLYAAFAYRLESIRDCLANFPELSRFLHF